MSILLVIAMYALWSNVFTLGKASVLFASPVFLTGFRMLLAAFILLVYVVIRKRSEFSLQKNQWISLALQGFFSVYLCNICELWGLQYLSSAKTCFIYSLSPIFTAILSYLHFKEKINGIKWFGLSIGFVGCLPVLFTQTGSEDLFSSSFLSLPTLSVIGAALFAVYGSILLRKNLKNTTISPLMANGVGMMVGGLLALVHSFFVDSWQPIPIVAGKGVEVLQNVLLITLISNIICSNIFGMLLRKYTATFLSFFGLLSPIFASLSGWFFLEEKLSWVILLSTGILSFGMWLVYRAELQQGYIVSSKKAAPQPLPE